MKTYTIHPAHEFTLSDGRRTAHFHPAAPVRVIDDPADFRVLVDGMRWKTSRDQFDWTTAKHTPSLLDYVDTDHLRHFRALCDELRHGNAVTLARYGDGEFNAILGKQGANCDGHEYFAMMGYELRRIFESNPPYWIGLHLDLGDLGRETLDFLERKGLTNRRYVWNGFIHKALTEGVFGEFFEAIRGREVCIVGPPHVRKIKGRINYSKYIEVSPRNCWKDTDRVYGQAMDWIRPGRNQVVIFCASMAANVWIHRLWQANKSGDVSLLDIGSNLDPYCGVQSRSYHKKIDKGN